MKCKRQKVVTLQSTLPNQSKTLRIVTFTKEQLPSSHLMETGELLGMIVFNDNQSTFLQDNTTFVRLLLAICNFPNIYNYSLKHQLPSVPQWQSGAALPLHGAHTVATITARIKLLAEDKSLNGLRMASLDFNIVQSETDLIMH